MFHMVFFSPAGTQFGTKGSFVLWSQSTIYNVSVDFLQVGSILSVFSFLENSPKKSCNARFYSAQVIYFLLSTFCPKRFPDF